MHSGPTACGRLVPGWLLIMPAEILPVEGLYCKKSLDTKIQTLAFWVFLFAFAVRFAIGLASLSSLDADSDAYRRLSQMIYKTGTFGLLDSQGDPNATAYRPLLYPWLLSWFGGLDTDRLPIALLHAVLGGLTVALTFDIARRLGLSRNVSLFASALVLVDPILVRQSTLVMTETLATFLGLAIWWATMVFGRSQSERGRGMLFEGAAIGVALGFACLCRPTALAWCVLWGAIELRRKPLRASGLLLGCLLVLFPWWVRNYSQFGQGVWTTTHGGYTLLLANNPILYEHWQSSPSREWDEDRFHDWWATKHAEKFNHTQADEIALDAFANQLGFETIRNNPGMFARACFIREGWLWAWWPSQRQADWKARWVVGLWYAITSVAALLGLRRLLAVDRKQLVVWLPALTLAASLCIVHAVYWSNMRMRAPMIPIVSLLAVHCCCVPTFGRYSDVRMQ